MSATCDGNEKVSTPAATSRTTDNLSSLPTDQNEELEDYLFGIDLFHKMDMDDITELRRHFYDDKRVRGTKRKGGSALTKAEFVEAVENVAGTPNLTGAAGNLFDYLDTDLTGTVTWDQVLDGIIEKTEPSTVGRSFWSPIDPNVMIYSATHCKREPIVKIVALGTKSAFCYVVISRLGRVGVYDGGFALLESYKLALKPNEETLQSFDREKEEKQRRSQTTWIADVVHIVDSNALLFASSDRSLHLYDANCLIHIPLCRIIGLQNVPTCMEYFASNAPGKPSLLFIGDDSGNIITMKFHQSKNTLFKKKHPDKLDSYYWSELHEQSDYVTYSIQTGVHDDVVIQVAYCPSNETLLSCSNDSVNTLVIRHIDERRQPYVFKVTRGIKCFHYDRSLHVIATGSNDFVVRLWNEVVTKQPVISLYGHKAPIVDVRIIKYMSAIISLSREGVVKVWDMNDYYCQMTLPMQFPILKVVGARIDFGTRSIYPGPKTVKEASNDTPSTPRTSGVSGIGLDEVETQMSVMELERKEENQWNRRCVVVACSNFIAVLRLVPLTFDAVEHDISESDGVILPPPPKEHYASAPSPWKIAESYAKTPKGSEEASSTGLSSGSSSTLEPSKKTFRWTKRRKGYKNFTADTIKSPMENMNMKRTEYVIRQEQMKMLVEQCAPHLALDLYELEPIKFSKPLPVTRGMKEKGIDVSDPERVMRAKIQKDPTLISLGSSSAAQSPHSSKSSKSTIPKKKFVPPRGRLTPDWFTEKIQSVHSDYLTDGSVELQ